MLLVRQPIQEVNTKFLIALVFLTMPLFAQPVVYPLNIGDTWQYKNVAVMTPDTFVYSFTASSDTLLGGKTYTVTYFGNNPVSIQRQSGDSVFLYRPGFEMELLYFDFSRTGGDTVSTTVLGSDTMDVVLTHTDVANYFGTSRRIWIFYVNRSRTTVDDEYSVTVADGLGIVQNVPSFGDPMALTGAIISGTRYGVVLGVQNHQHLSPTYFVLTHNFPNPFNPTTTVRFFLPQSSHVTFEVYNNIGQIVDRRQFFHLSPGFHDVRFDGSALSSGVYYYRIMSTFGIATNKMLLTK